MDNNIKELYEEVSGKLKKSGYKLTPQRQVTLETLVENNVNLLTAEEVFILVKKKNSSIGLATVYRTLDMLKELDVVKKIPFRDGMSRYDLVRDVSEKPPFYLLCQSCGKITEIKDNILADVKNRLEQEYRFKVNTHHLTFHGLCEECRDRKEQENGK